jgi:hypothetical protein
MSELNPLAYAAPPEDPTGPDDHYYTRALAFCHWAFGAIHAFSGMMVCFVVPQTRARTFGAAMIVGGLLCAVAGLFLFIKRGPWFILTACVLTLPLFPIGTILGLCTIYVMQRRGVRALFRRAAADRHREELT